IRSIHHREACGFFVLVVFSYFLGFFKKTPPPPPPLRIFLGVMRWLPHPQLHDLNRDFYTVNRFNMSLVTRI
ncbi:hypothetical protein, partial [Bifidobacterium aquikefiri]|uniref:hypothetical protein n=1 Tax=Bifidobacterium aquikefiri TaxID=1653207 RepID=UPI0039E8CF0F